MMRAILEAANSAAVAVLLNELVTPPHLKVGMACAHS